MVHCEANGRLATQSFGAGGCGGMEVSQATPMAGDAGRGLEESQALNTGGTAPASEAMPRKGWAPEAKGEKGRAHDTRCPTGRRIGMMEVAPMQREGPRCCLRRNGSAMGDPHLIRSKGICQIFRAELAVDDFQILHRVDAVLHVDHIGVLKRTADVEDSVHRLGKGKWVVSGFQTESLDSNGATETQIATGRQ